MRDGDDAGHRFDPTILREYDIRGVVGETLSRGRCARASAAASPPCWSRPAAGASRSAATGGCSSPELEAALVDGLTECRHRRGAHRARPDADALLRGQHARRRWRHHGHGLAQSAELQRLQDDARQEAVLRRATSSASARSPPRAISRAARARRERAARCSTTMSRGCSQDYDGTRPLKVAWDAGNGATGEALQRLTQKLPGTHVLLNETIDGTLPGASSRSDRAEEPGAAAGRGGAQKAAISASPSTATATASAWSTARAASCGATSSWCCWRAT